MSTKTPAPAKTPTIAIARILRGLGLKQGTDFRVSGEYRGTGANRERVGTRVTNLNSRANQVIADNADQIEQSATATGFPFHVSIYRAPGGYMWVRVANYGERVRQSHFLDTDADRERLGLDVPEVATSAAGDTPTGMKPEPEDVNAARYVYQPGVAVVRLDGDGRVVRTGSVSHVSEPVHMVNDPYHENYGRAYVDVMWDGDGVVRSFVFTSDIRPA